MTQDEIDKYINQIAFLELKSLLTNTRTMHKPSSGHFGLGFYSAFMVSKKVEIITKSYKEGTTAVKGVAKEILNLKSTTAIKADRGTDIVLHIDDDNKDFWKKLRSRNSLKILQILPIPIVFGKKKEWKDGKETETDEDNIINDINPAWTRKPTDLKDEDYKNFYKELYPYAEDPLFYIHLNVDFPFHLTGILLFS